MAIKFSTYVANLILRDFIDLVKVVFFLFFASPETTTITHRATDAAAAALAAIYCICQPQFVFAKALG